MEHFHLTLNLYLICIFIGVIITLIRLYEIKLILKTFFATTNLLGRYINSIEEELHKEEALIGSRVDRVCSDVLKILTKLEEERSKLDVGE